MKKLLLLGLIAIIASCTGTPKETYPYGMTEKEWDQLSIKDKTTIRRDFYFMEKGTTNFVNPTLEVEGKKEPMPAIYMQQPKRNPATEL